MSQQTNTGNITAIIFPVITATARDLFIALLVGAVLSVALWQTSNTPFMVWALMLYNIILYALGPFLLLLHTIKTLTGWQAPAYIVSTLIGTGVLWLYMEYGSYGLAMGLFMVVPTLALLRNLAQGRKGRPA